MFYATKPAIYFRFDTDDMVLVITMIHHDLIPQTLSTHGEQTGTNMLTYIYKHIFTSRVMCTQQRAVLH